MDPLEDLDITGFLLLVQRVQQTGRVLGRETLVPFAEIKLPRVARGYDRLVRALQEQNWIRGSTQEFTLTPAGLEALRGACQNHSLHTWFYNEYYHAIVHSQAHSLFCQRVYGKDLGQHGMMDMAQLQDLIAELQIEAGMSLLDFGCGDGQISEYLADATQTFVTGVDLADQAIQLAQERTRAKRDRLQFTWADLERKQGHFPTESFDRIVAIDSLFFVQDQPAVTRLCLDHLRPGGRLGVFYICPPQVSAAETVFAAALTALGLPFRARDYTAQNTEHWKKKEQALLELESMFTEEGNDFLFKNRLAECQGMQNFHRYLYVVTRAQGCLPPEQ